MKGHLESVVRRLYPPSVVADNLSRAGRAYPRTPSSLRDCWWKGLFATGIASGPTKAYVELYAERDSADASAFPGIDFAAEGMHALSARR